MNYYKKVMYFTFFLASYEDTELKDCAGVDGGNAICGCTDIVASNFDSLATFDDGSCEYLLNGIPIEWLKTYQVSKKRKKRRKVWKSYLETSHGPRNVLNRKYWPQLLWDNNRLSNQLSVFFSTYISGISTYIHRILS